MTKFLGIFAVNFVLALAVVVFFGVLLGLLYLAYVFTGLVGMVLVGVFEAVVVGSFLEYQKKK